MSWRTPTAIFNQYSTPLLDDNFGQDDGPSYDDREHVTEKEEFTRATGKSLRQVDPQVLDSIAINPVDNTFLVKDEGFNLEGAYREYRLRTHFEAKSSVYKLVMVFQLLYAVILICMDLMGESLMNETTDQGFEATTATWHIRFVLNPETGNLVCPDDACYAEPRSHVTFIIYGVGKVFLMFITYMLRPSNAQQFGFSHGEPTWQRLTAACWLIILFSILPFCVLENPSPTSGPAGLHLSPQLYGGILLGMAMDCVMVVLVSGLRLVYQWIAILPWFVCVFVLSLMYIEAVGVLVTTSMTALIALLVVVAKISDLQHRLTYRRKLKLKQLNSFNEREVDAFSVDALTEWITGRPSMRISVSHVVDAGNAKKGRLSFDSSRSASRFALFEINANEIEFGRRIAGGSAGQVLEGTYNKTKVAVKQIFSALVSGANDMQALQEFSQEVSALSKLTHPYIVRFYGICKVWDHDEVGINMVMEFAPSSLARELKLNNWLVSSDKPKIYRVAYEIASAMSYLHRNNILHLDLKPDNVLIQQEAQGTSVVCKLADFGLSSALTRDNYRAQAKNLSGSPGYMAPEVAYRYLRSQGLVEDVECHFAWHSEREGEHLQLERLFKQDVYAFGIVMAAIVTAGEPYSQELDADQLIQGLVKKGLRPTNNVPVNTCENYQAIMAKCWCNAPLNRPIFCDLRDNLHHIIEDAKLHEAKFQAVRIRNREDSVADNAPGALHVVTK